MIEAMKQALEALETAWYHVGTFAPTDDAIELYDQAKTSLRQAIAEAEKQVQNEPDDEVLGFNGWGFPIEHPPKPTPANKEQIREALVFNLPLYTTPQQRTWVGLNLDDVPEIYVDDTAFLHGAQWAEAKLKEKNFGE